MFEVSLCGFAGEVLVRAKPQRTQSEQKFKKTQCAILDTEYKLRYDPNMKRDWIEFNESSDRHTTGLLYASLNPKGRILLNSHTYDAMKRLRL